jgi:hypothetical protein
MANAIETAFVQGYAERGRLSHVVRGQFHIGLFGLLCV